MFSNCSCFECVWGSGCVTLQRHAREIQEWQRRYQEIKAKLDDFSAKTVRIVQDRDAKCEELKAELEGTQAQLQDISEVKTGLAVKVRACVQQYVLYPAHQHCKHRVCRGFACARLVCIVGAARAC